MPIPPFDGILNVLPPHLGNPTRPNELWPFLCTAAELCRRFATTAARKQILDGFLKLCAELLAIGVRGFQWLGGSFLEDIESQENRDPRDIDAITFVASPPTPAELSAILIGPRPDLWTPAETKRLFFVDHYVSSLGTVPAVLVQQARYWYALFSHRGDGVWKGMLAVELIDRTDDDAARLILGGGP